MLTEQQQDATAKPKAKWAAISAVVTRADGTVERRGIISFQHQNPIINFVGAPIARFNGWLRERWARFKRRKS